MAFFVAVVVLGAAGSAFAFFAASGSDNGAAKAGTLVTPAASAAVTGTGAITISWSAPSQLAGTTYTVTRTSPTSATVCTAVSGTSCQDTSVTPGTGYQYSVVASLGLWQATGNTAPINGFGTATTLGFTQPPSSSTGGVAFAMQPKVAVEDAFGNTVTTATTSVTLAILNNAGPGGSLACTVNPLSATAGVAAFTGCKIDKAGTGYTLKANGGGFTQADSSPFDITVGPATKLGFTIQPGGGTGGTPFGTQPAVAIEDAGGNTVTTAPATQIALAILNNAGPGGTLSCTTNPVSTASGVATFAGCKIDKAGTGYTLKANGGALTQAASAAFNVTVGPAASISFTTSPGNSTEGVAFAAQPVVTVVDAGGNPVSGTSVTLSITTGTGAAGAVLSCSNNTVGSNAGGAANFAACAINKSSGAAYSLKATAGALTATSTTFAVSGAVVASVTTSNQNGKPESADTITITFSGPVAPSSICSSWVTTGAHDLAGTSTGNANISVTLTKPGSGNNTLGVSDTADCSGDFKIFSGNSLNLGTTGYVTSASALFGPNGHCNGGHPCADVSIDATDRVLTITLGEQQNGTVGTVASNPGVTYNPNAGITGQDGVAVAGSATDAATKFF